MIRAAYGISSFMEANGVNNLPYQNPPFVEAHELINPATQALPTTQLESGIQWISRFRLYGSGITGVFSGMS